MGRPLTKAANIVSILELRGLWWWQLWQLDWGAGCCEAVTDGGASLAPRAPGGVRILRGSGEGVGDLDDAMQMWGLMCPYVEFDMARAAPGHREGA